MIPIFNISSSDVLVHDPEVAQIERDQKQIMNWLQMRPAHVCAPLAGEAKAVSLNHFVDILSDWNSTCNL